MRRAHACCCRSELVAAPARSSDVLALPDPRTRERVPVQPLPHPQAAHRDRARALPHRATDQDLVPEPPHEGQEGEDADHGAERAREIGVVMATSSSAAAARCGDARATRLRCCRCCSRSLTSCFSSLYAFYRHLCATALHDKLYLKMCSRIDMHAHAGSAPDTFLHDLKPFKTVLCAVIACNTLQLLQRVACSNCTTALSNSAHFRIITYTIYTI